MEDEIQTSDATEPCVSDACGSADSTATPELAMKRSPRQEKPWEATDLSKRPTRDDIPDAPDHLPRRWDRFVRLVGEDGAKRLQASHVTIIGLGGVGGYVAESLIRSAVGRMTLVDFDDVCVTNVNRQIQAFPTTVGQSKTMLLAERVRAINPDAWIDPVQAFYGADTSEAILSPRPDFVVDAIDNVTAKVHLLHTCLQRKIPVVSVAGAGARWDPTQIRIADLSETKIDALARVVRKELSKRGVDTTRHVGLPMVYSDEHAFSPLAPSWDEDSGFRCICPHKEDSPHACEKRRIIYGTAGFVTSAFASAASSVVVRSLVAPRE